MTTPCTNCGAELPEDARFCPRCGHPVDAPGGDDRDRLTRLAAAAPATLVDKARGVVLAGSRRPVTSLFADVVGSTSIVETLDPEEWRTLINAAFDVMARAVYRYEGTVARLMGDGMLAFFGAPVAHEDDPVRAVQAGMDMIADMSELAALSTSVGDVALRLRVGIDTGPVVVGNVGSDLTYEYTALGDAVNVAARLQGMAEPGTVVIAEATHRLVAHRFEAVDLGELELKGKRERVQAYRVVGPLAQPLPARGLPGLHSPLIGRDSELASLEARLRHAADGDGGVVFLVGEPGIGKSRLVAELHARAQRAGNPVTWVEGGCQTHGRNLPYHLLLSLLRSLFGIETTGDAVAGAALRLQLQSLLGDRWEHAHGPLCHLLSLPLNPDVDAEMTRLDPKARHQRYHEAIDVLLRAVAAATPLVLVCEDVHWADSASAELLANLLPAVRETPTLVLVTTRRDPDTPLTDLHEAARMVIGEQVTELQLTSLSGDQSSALVAALLEIESLPPNTRSFILDRAEGNPFFLEEVIRTLIDRRAIEHDGRVWTANETELGRELPETLHGLLLARMDLLPDRARRTARVAAVIGRRFQSTLLRAVLDGPGQDLDDVLDQLTVAGVIQDAGDHDGYLQFRHVLVQEAAYDSLLRADRQQVHLRVAEALLERAPGHEADLAGEVAQHFEDAGDVGRAVDHLIVAGQHALARFAVHEAGAFLDRAAAHLESLEGPDRLRQRVEVALGRVRATITFLPVSHGLGILDEILPGAEMLGDPALLAAALVEQAGLLAQASTPDSADRLRDTLARIEQLVETVQDDRLQALPLYFEGARRYQAGDLVGAIEIADRAVPLLERNGEYPRGAELAGVAAIAAARIGDFPTADTFIGRARDLAARSGDPNAILDVDIWQGMIASERGELTQGIEVTRRGVEQAVRVDNKECQVVGHFVIGEQEWRNGQPELAIESFQLAREVAQYCEYVHVEVVADAWLSAARADQTPSAQTLAELDASLERAREVGDPFVEASVQILRAQARRQGPAPDLPAVLMDYEAGLALLKDIGARPAFARALTDYADALEQVGRSSEASARHEEARALLAELGITTPTTSTS